VTLSDPNTYFKVLTMTTLKSIDYNVAMTFVLINN